MNLQVGVVKLQDKVQTPNEPWWTPNEPWRTLKIRPLLCLASYVLHAKTLLCLLMTLGETRHCIFTSILQEPGVEAGPPSRYPLEGEKGQVTTLTSLSEDVDFSPTVMESFKKLFEITSKPGNN